MIVGYEYVNLLNLFYKQLKMEEEKMKRILSILLSMALIASLLVSMSVNSFAVAVKENANGDDVATVETTVESIDATEFANSGKALDAGTYGWLITTTVTFNEDYMPNVKYGATYEGRLVNGLSFEYFLGEEIIYSKKSGPKTTYYAFSSDATLAMTLTADKQNITYIYAPQLVDETYPLDLAWADDNYDWDNGVERPVIVQKTYVATTVPSFNMDVKTVITNSLLEEENEVPVITLDTISPQYWERDMAVGEVETTTYNITFVVDGQEDVVVEVAENELPEYPNGTPSKDGYTFEGWDKTIVEATEDATYTAVFKEIVIPDAVEVTNVAANNKNVFPGTTSPIMTVMVGESEVELDITKLHRVDTTFNYTGALAEMGMLFIPKAVVDADDSIDATAESIANSGKAANANCSELPEDITGVNTNVTFKAGLYNVPAEYKGITIYAVPYYTLSGGTRQYYTVQTTTF